MKVYSPSEVAKLLELNTATFREYKNKHPALSAALKKGKEQEYINKRLNERDGVLMQAMNEILETKKQLAITHGKQGFFRRLFNKK